MTEVDSAASVDVTEKKGLRGYVKEIFARPCFSSSFYYGTCSGVGGLLLTFLFTSRARIASHTGVGVFCTVTLAYFCVCRDRVERSNLKMTELQKTLNSGATIVPPEPKSTTKKPEFVDV